MTGKNEKLVLQNFHAVNDKNNELKVLEEAMVYLKLREHGCPKSKALIFAKKKQQATDATVRKDGPAGFRKLVPQKPTGKLENGWLKGQKLKYKGLRGFSQEIKRNISKQKTMITAYNQQYRRQFEYDRLKQKQHNPIQDLIRSGETKLILEQIGLLKDQFHKDKEKRNLFLSYDGLRLDQYTRTYFQKIQEQNTESLIVKLAAFSGPINDQKFQIETDWEIAKGRSLNFEEIEGQKKRKSVLQFRKSISSLNLPSTDRCKLGKKLSTILYESNKIGASSSLKKVSKQQRLPKQQKDLQQFYTNIDKLIWLKTKQLPST